MSSIIKVLGIDLGKSCFHAIGRDQHGQVIFKKKFTRKTLLGYLAQLPPCTVAFEACGGAHWLGRYCQARGHVSALIPPQYVRPYVQGNKNDFIDAYAITEAVNRPHMRRVPVKSVDAQVIGAQHRIRDGFITERTRCMSRIGALLLEFGLSLPCGHATMKRLYAWLSQQKADLCPALIGELQVLHDHYNYLNTCIEEQDRKIKQQVRDNEICQRLKTIPGIGDITASLVVAEVGSAQAFKNGREFSAWLGMVPRQYSTGGKAHLGGISKRGNKRLRCLFVHGARSLLSRLDSYQGALYTWLRNLHSRKPFNVACLALANKLARIVCAVLKSGDVYQGA